MSNAQQIVREVACGATLLQVARRHGITTDRVWQILRRAAAKKHGGTA